MKRPFSSLFAAAVLGLLLAGCASVPNESIASVSETEANAATHDAPPAPSEDGGAEREERSDDSLPVDPEVIVGTLPNGLTYYIRENNEPEQRAFLRMAVNAGSILEDEDQQGLAHFLEHMAFNGTESYSGNELIAFLERLGMQFGPDINAYTSFDETVYMLDVPTDDPETFSTALNVLFEWSSRIALDPEEIDKERGVIVEEWRYRRSAEARMSEEQYPVLFGDSKYAQRLPIGDMELVRSFEPSVLERFYDDWYRPDLTAIIAVGDFSAPDVERQIRERFAAFDSPEDPRPREYEQVPPHDTTRYVVASDPETSYTTVSVYVKRDAEELESREDYRRMLAAGLFTSMFNSRLEDITREPDAPFLGAGVSIGSLVRTEDAATISAAVEGNDVAPALEALVVELRRVTEHGFTATELERAKRNQLRSMQQVYRERENANSQNFADEYVRAFLTGEAIPGIPSEWELHQEIIPTLTLNEVNELAESYLRDENRVVVVSAVESDDLEPVRETDLRSAFRRAEAIAVDPYEDAVVSTELLGELPTPGTIVSQTELDAEGVLDWRLSNGARVLVMPTDHREDQILFTAFSPGGTSTVDESEFRSAQFATVFTEQMGYGEFSPSDLQRVLAGKALSVAPYIDLYEEGFSGSSSTEDLETALQVLHLKMTDPRRHEPTFAALKRQFLTVVANQENQPQFHFSRRFQELFNQDHPRALPVEREGMEAVDLDAVLDAYRARFGDASDFTFVFVGTVDPAELRSLAEQYLATLPTADDTGWRDVGISRPDGTVTDTVRAGQEPVAEVVVAFHGKYEFSRRNNYAIRALERMLDIRMQEVIREDESGTYGVSVQAQFSDVPNGRYSILLNFRADPARIDQLTERLFEVIESIRESEPEQSYVERIQETQRAQFREQLTSNQFWLSRLSYAIQHDRPVSTIRDYLGLVDGLSASDVTDSARRYLDRNRYVRVTLLPEEGVDE
ncbi:MAG: M16 family metallopeptidase [Spirochaetota bacterium]